MLPYYLLTTMYNLLKVISPSFLLYTGGTTQRQPKNPKVTRTTLPASTRTMDNPATTTNGTNMDRKRITEWTKLKREGKRQGNFKVNMQTVKFFICSNKCQNKFYGLGKLPQNNSFPPYSRSRIYKKSKLVNRVECVKRADQNIII